MSTPGGSLWDRDSVKAIPVLLAVLLLLKAYVVSGYSLVTASALVTSAPVAVLVSTITSFLHIVVLVLFLVTSGWLYRSWRDRDAPDDAVGRSNHEVTMLVFAVWTMCLLFLPVPLSIRIYREQSSLELAYTMAVCASGLGLWWMSNRVADRKGRRRMEGGWFAVLVGIALIVPTLSTPWMPSEIWVLDQPIAPSDLHDLTSESADAGGALSRYPVVFVLSVDSTWAVGLDVDTRLVLDIPSRNLKARVVCKYEGQPANTLPLYAFIFGHRWETPNRFCGNLTDSTDELDRLVPVEPTTTPG